MSHIQPRAVLWDMDGVLIDSAQHHFDAWREALRMENFDLSYDAFKRTFGQRNDTVLSDLFGRDVPPDEVARIADLKERLYRDYVRERGIAPLPGVTAWLARLRDAGWQQAVASAAPRANVDAILEATGIGAFFGAVTSAEDVTRGKPDPQVYLLAAERLGVAPSRSVVIEDAPAGVEGAKRAGMKCIGVKSTHGELDADIVVHSLEELPDGAFAKLIGDVAMRDAYAFDSKTEAVTFCTDFLQGATELTDVRHLDGETRITYWRKPSGEAWELHVTNDAEALGFTCTLTRAPKFNAVSDMQ
jgi:beta-phosphoglucomutase